MKNILTHEEVLEVEVQLLHTLQEKHSLSKYYTPIHDASESDFKQNDKIKAQLNKQFGIQEVICCGHNCNSIFRVLTAVFMRIFFMDNHAAEQTTSEIKGRPDLLQHLKCTLYSQELNLQQIQNSPISSLSSTDMKKILVELFQVLKYNDGPVEIILDKYPIVQEIFILFLRAVLMKITGGVFGEENYLAKVENEEIVDVLLDYFDITYQKRKGLYVMFEDNQFVHIDNEAQQVAYGQLQGKIISKSQIYNLQNKFEENPQFNFEEHQLDFLCEDKKQTIVSTPTPFFAELNDDQTNFNRRSINAKNRRKESLHQIKKELSIKMQESTNKAIRQQQDEEQDKKSDGKAHKNHVMNNHNKQRKMSEFISNRSSMKEGEENHKEKHHKKELSAINLQENSHNIYFDKDGNREKFYDKKLEAIQSPIPSSPEGADSIKNQSNAFESKQEKHWQSERENQEQQSEKQRFKRSNRKEHKIVRSSNELDGHRNMKSSVNESESNKVDQNDRDKQELIKSFPYKNKRKASNHTSNHNDDLNDFSESVGSSCACSSIKSKKNSLNSNVIGVSFVPSFKKKEVEILRGKKPDGDKQPKKQSKIKYIDKTLNQKMPDFIFKRPNSYNQSSQSRQQTRQYQAPSNPDLHSIVNEQINKKPIQSQSQKPKISFTYAMKEDSGPKYHTQRAYNPTNYNNSMKGVSHIQTEPSYMMNGQNLRSYRQHYRYPSEYRVGPSFFQQQLPSRYI